ncbi:DUF1801 domain-containing protein [Spirosoma endbachense]|uniref:DUF1801 domain-containing protein n=1 Tax=Spirosoma endbachense TaxID=2666025 RepID=A0A6P1VQV8_9BACT|nr:DUF1801 domain-containing protein [Spirosoma endbachense]QHV95075.1 DUF1801 domain-containing protein [Spirosoma endbachense]
MAKNKTTENENSVEDYLNAIPEEKKRKDCSELITQITTRTGLTPKMWGTGIVGFGSYHYIYESGREGDAPLTGLASRSTAITLYLATSFDQKQELLQKLGKHKAGKGCIYIQKLDDIDMDVLSQLILDSIDHIRNQFNNV